MRTVSSVPAPPPITACWSRYLAALIIPVDQSLTDLIQASFAWQEIAKELAAGKTVGQAVAAAWNRIGSAQFKYKHVGSAKVTIAGVRTQ